MPDVLDFAGRGHYANDGLHEPSAEGCARRVAFRGWSYVLAPARNGAALFYEESWHCAGRHVVPFARVLAGKVVDADGATLGYEDELKTSIRRPGDLPLKASARWPVPCACAGCAPVSVDDGHRPRTRVFFDNTTAAIVPMRRRAVEVSSAVAPADEETGERVCVGCGLVKKIAALGRCWVCFVAGERVKVNV